MFGVAISFAIAAFCSQSILRLMTRIRVLDLRGLSLPLGTRDKLLFQFREFMSGCLSVGGFAVVAAITYLAFFASSAADRLAFFYYLVPTCVFLVSLRFLQVFWSPMDRTFRLPDLSDVEARKLYWSYVVTIGFAAFAFFTCALIYTLGISGPEHELFLVVVTAVSSGFLGFAFFLNRNAIRKDLDVDGKSGGWLMAWPLVLSFVPIALWSALFTMTVLELNAPYGAALFTVLVLAVFPHIDAAVKRQELEFSKLEEGALEFAISRAVRPILGILTILGLVYAWGIGPKQSSTDTYWSTLANSMVYIFAGVALWRFSDAYIGRMIEIEDGGDGEANVDLGETEIGGAGLSRTRTLLPLARRVVQAFVLVTIIISVLSAIGVEIGPVLAGAGVLGLAIGFGSQTLVRDIVSGVFFLIDDAVRIGEYIDTGSVMGVVEKMSVRSMQLRHHRGAVHTVPFGEIQSLTNYSRDWAIMKLRFTVPFDTDLEKVRKLLKKAGQQLAENEDIRDDFIQPFKAQGAVEASDHGFVISTKFMSKPGKQFLIRRYAFATVQRAFEENGIKFARPTINVASDRDEVLEPKVEELAAAMARAEEKNKSRNPGLEPT
ncbi:hypothetical protein NBRC116590_17260 [Pelagimonas sp. KU-00592-HH]